MSCLRLVPLLSLVACAALQSAPDDRPVLLKRVDDVAIAQLHADGFENLSASDQALAWHLSRAAIAGRDIFLQQRCEVALQVRDLLEEILTHPQGVDPATLAELQRYAELFWVNNGLHNATTARKNVLRCTPEALLAAAKRAVANGAELPPAPRSIGTLERQREPEGLLGSLRPWLFDPDFEPLCTAKNPEGGLDIVQASSCTFYGPGVTLADLEGFEPRYELNSNVVKGPDGKLVEQVWRVGSPADGIPPGLYARELGEVIGCLQDAMPFAPAPTRAALEKLVRFYRTGEVADREAYDIAWVADNQSPVDTINGFIEVYTDPRGRKGAFEGVVSYEDPKKAALIKGLATSAQWFEDRMPWDPAFRKPEVKGISARSIDVVCETGDGGPVSAVGINLPNDQRIREEYGSKSVSLANVVAVREALESGAVLEEFCFDEAELARSAQWGAITDEMKTNMHEVIGHASGQQDAEHQGEPARWIAENYSALEEARADLVALWFLPDPKLKELGLLEDPPAAARAAYEQYTRNGLMLQLRRIREGELIEDNHMRNRHMIAHWILQNSEAIEPRERDGKRFYVVTDPVAWQQAAGRLLAEVQRIKSTGDYEGAKRLFDEHGDRFDPALRDEVVARYDRLGVHATIGLVQPRLSPVWGADGALHDVEISYPESLAVQMLEWSGRRLPPVTLPADPAALWHTVLQRLLEAPDLELEATIVAEGAHTADLRGRLRARSGNRLELSCTGPLDGKDLPRSLHSSGTSLSFDNKPSASAVPERLVESAIQGFMRRGLLYELSFLASGSAPDPAEGTPEGSVPHGFKALGDGRIDGRRTRRIEYTLAVGGEDKAEVRLDVDARDGLPLAREVTAHFPKGDMRVKESYVVKRPVE